MKKVKFSSFIYSKWQIETFQKNIGVELGNFIKWEQKWSIDGFILQKSIPLKFYLADNGAVANAPLLSAKQLELPLHDFSYMFT